MDILCPVLRWLSLLQSTLGRHLCDDLVLSCPFLVPCRLVAVAELYDLGLIVFGPCVLEHQRHVNHCL